MAQIRWNRKSGLCAVVIVLGLTLSSCSLSLEDGRATDTEPPAVTSEASSASTPEAEDVAVSVEFPGRNDLQAETELVAPTEKMVEAAPAGADISNAVDVTLMDGQFPDSGATMTFALPEPVDEHSAPVIAHWNEDLAEWEVQLTTLSEDGTRVSATVTHFSIYAVIEDIYNTANTVVGNFADRPKCPGSPPEWSDVVFLDDQNGPVLWCVGTDEKDPDIMEVRMVANRSSAMLVSTAIEPVWAWSDILGDTSPGTWIATALGGDLLATGMASQYLIPPKGEYRFGFAKEDLFEFWRTGQDPALIHADVSSGTAVAGLIYGAVAENATGAMAAVTTIVALAECGHGVKATAQNPSMGSVTSTMLGCLTDRKDTLQNLAAKQIAKMDNLSWDAAKEAASTAGSRVRFAVGIYALSKAHLTLGSLIGDALIDPIAVQLHFTPSATSIPEALGRTGPDIDVIPEDQLPPEANAQAEGTEYPLIGPLDYYYMEFDGFKPGQPIDAAFPPGTAKGTVGHWYVYAPEPIYVGKTVAVEDLGEGMWVKAQDLTIPHELAGREIPEGGFRFAAYTENGELLGWMQLWENAINTG